MTRAEHVGRNLVALRALDGAANAQHRRRHMPLVLAHTHGRGRGIPLQIGGGAAELAEPWQVLQGVFGSAKSTVPLRCKVVVLINLVCSSTTL